MVAVWPRSIRLRRSRSTAGSAMAHTASVRRLVLLSTVAALLVLLASAIGAGAAARPAGFPAGFNDTTIASPDQPTTLAFTPDGRILVSSQTGKLWVIKDDVLQSTAVLDLGDVLCSDFERGLLGVAVDPNYANNHYIYVYYTFKRFGGCPANTDQSPVNRVSRFTLPTTGVIARSTELVLVDNIPSPNGNHNGGDLQFGKDGYLYISVGDGGCDYAHDSGCSGQNNASRDENVLSGKVLRITPDGGIPPTNPFQGSDSTRCNVAGPNGSGKKCQETFARGLRNPFRIAFDPNAAGTRFFINDVGQDHWEEIDVGQAAADYGWNVREGHCANGSDTNCGSPPSGMTNPLVDYNHNTGCAAITGGAFVPNGIWPTAFDGAYLYADYVCGKIFRIDAQTGGTPVEFATDLGSSSVIAMHFGPYKTTQALYYITFNNGGEVHRVAYTGSANRPPIAHVSATPTAGAVPLVVAFDGRTSSDPDGDPLTYDWNWGDGTTLLASPNAQPHHTYQVNDTYHATLTVRDGRGGVSAPASVQINAGNALPQPEILSPATTTAFRVGQKLVLTGRATDKEDGVLSDSALRWEVLLHHIDSAHPGNAHTHPYFPPTTGNNLDLIAPAPEDLAAAALSYIEVRLTATDTQGNSATVSRNVQPHWVDVSFATAPGGFSVMINGQAYDAPRTFRSWEGYRLQLLIPVQQDAAGTWWIGQDWSDGGAPTHSVTTPASATTYTAHLVAAIPIWLPNLQR